MAEDGPVDPAFFETHVAPRLGSDRGDVAVGPRDGGTFGTLTTGGTAVALAADPLLVAPALGFERAGRFAVGRALGAVACSGLAPTHLAVDWNLPPGMDDAAFEAAWQGVDAVARESDVAVLTGHTGRYEGCAFPAVGAATAFAAGGTADLVRPGGARPGDRVVVTKGPAVGTTGLLGGCLGPELAAATDEATAGAAGERLADASHVRDALTAAAGGPVTAMTDATGGGVVGGLHDLARAAGVGIEGETDPLPVLPGVAATCEWAGLDPWTASSQGTLVAAVDPSGVGDVLAALSEAEIPAATAGRVVEGSGVRLDGEGREYPAGTARWRTVVAEER